MRRGPGIVAVLTVFLGCDSSHPPTPASVRLGLPAVSSGSSPRTPRQDPSLLDSLAPQSPQEQDTIRLVGGADGVLVLWRANSGEPPALAPPPPVARLGLPDGWSAGWVAAPPGETVVLEVNGVVVAGTAGTLPAPHRATRLPGSPDACGDRLFPSRVAGGLATCTEPGRLDRWERRPLPTPLEPGQAAGAPWGIALASLSLGVWSPRASRLVPYRKEPLGRPGAGAGLVVVATRDRLEYGEAGSPRRSVLGARPLAGRGAPAISAEHLAWIDGHRVPKLLLHRLSPPSAAALPGTSDPSQPQLSAGWLTFADGEALRGVGLRGQGSWSAQIDCGFSDGHASVDDWRLVPDRSEGRLRVLAVHLPTGAVLPAWEGDKWVRLRGADPSGQTAHVYHPGTPGELVERTTDLRLLEEDGAVASSPLSPRVGGHGGRHGHLAPGDSHHATVTPGPEGRLSVWMPTGAGEGTIRAVQRGATVGSLAAADHPDGGWVPLGRVARGAPVQVTWTARPGGDGLAVDALRIERRAP